MNEDMDLEIMAYNMRIIRAFWKCIKKDYGENIIRGNENDRNSFYATLEKSKESIRQIESGAPTSQNRKIIAKWAEKIDKKTGISFKYLSGRERISLSKEFDAKYFEQYFEYIEQCDELDKLLKKAHNEHMGYDRAEVIKRINSNKYTIQEKIEFRNIIDNAMKTVKMIKDFESALLKEVMRVANLDMGQLLETDKKLYKLVYFIKTGNPSDAMNTVTREDILRVLERTKMVYLYNLDKGELERYIKALKRQLAFAEAVYIEKEEI